MIPEFLDKPNVLGIGEIGLNKNTRNESIIFLEHLELAVKHDQQILIHTPHLEDKYQGTRMILDMLCDDSRLERSRVLVDHVEEHTIRHVLEEGFWAGMTLYPVSKCTPQRACDMIEMYGPERLIRKVVYENPHEFFSQSRNFNFVAPDLAEREVVS